MVLRDIQGHRPVFAQPLEVKAILDPTEVGQLVSKAQLTKEEFGLGDLPPRAPACTLNGRWTATRRGSARKAVKAARRQGPRVICGKTTPHIRGETRRMPRRSRGQVGAYGPSGILGRE
ncbi:MAG: hypothetical protein GY856_17375 [bacterium]|nr:hypothetical protein [bacterium]